MWLRRVLSKICIPDFQTSRGPRFWPAWPRVIVWVEHCKTWVWVLMRPVRRRSRPSEKSKTPESNTTLDSKVQMKGELARHGGGPILFCLPRPLATTRAQFAMIFQSEITSCGAHCSFSVDPSEPNSIDAVCKFD